MRHQEKLKDKEEKEKMNYESVMWVLTVVVAAVLVLIALTNVFAQVVKKLINREKYPAQVVVFVIAEALTYLTMAIMCSILAVQILWYYWVLAFIVGVLVTYGAIFGYDNLYSQIGTAVMNFIQALFNRKEG
jgi:quinol-cytochrome oxidoreductase complex cytochrome b subunit